MLFLMCNVMFIQCVVPNGFSFTVIIPNTHLNHMFLSPMIETCFKGRKIDLVIKLLIL